MDKWAIHCIGSEGYQVILDNTGLPATEIKGHIRERMTPIVRSMGGDWETQHKNANKIVLSQDMYNALKIIIKRVETEGSTFQEAYKSIGQEGLINSFIAEAKQVIAKVEDK
jgi:hypothetical protein